jgi:hypothetical protein
MNKNSHDFSYSDAIDYLAEERENYLFINSGQVKGLWTLQSLIKYSKKEIKIFDKEENTKNYNKEIINELYKFIWKKDGNLKILLDAFEEKSLFHDFVEFYYKTGNIKLSLTDKKFLNRDNEEGKFALGDYSKFALSFKRNGKQRTLGNFNDKGFAGILNEFFEDNFNSLEHSKPLELEKII